MDVAAARRVAWPSLPYVWPALAALTLVYFIAGKIGLSQAGKGVRVQEPESRRTGAG